MDKVYFVVRLQSQQPNKPAMHIEPMVLESFRSKLDIDEDPDYIYDYSRQVKTTDGSRVIIAARTPDRDGNQINLQFEGHQRQSVQTMMLDHVFAKAKRHASVGSVDVRWRPVMGDQREQVSVKEGEGHDAVYHWFELVELDVGSFV